MGRSGVEYHGTDAEASLTSGRRPSGVGGYGAGSPGEAVLPFLTFAKGGREPEREGCLTREQAQQRRREPTHCCCLPRVSSRQHLGLFLPGMLLRFALFSGSWAGLDSDPEGPGPAPVTAPR